MSAAMVGGEIAEKSCPKCGKGSKSPFCPKCGACEWCHERIDGILVCLKN